HREPGAGSQGPLYERGVGVTEPELRSAEEPERAVRADVAPGQSEVAVGAVAADEGTAEVEAVCAAPDGDLDLPARRGGVAGDGLDRAPRVARHGQAGPVLARAAQRQVDVLVSRLV